MTPPANWSAHVDEPWSYAVVDGRGPTLLWLHGLGERAETFAAPIAHLPHHRHLVLDLPGHGGARARVEVAPPSIDETAERVIEFLMIHGPAAIVGHSLGGVIALTLAERCTANLRAVIDVDGNVSIDDCTYSSQIAAYAEPDYLARGHGEVCDRLEAHADPIVRGYGGRVRTAAPAQLWRYSRDLVDAAHAGRLAARRAAVFAPYHYVAGAPGGASPASRALLAEASVCVHELGPAGHWPFLEHPARFAALVAAIVG